MYQNYYGIWDPDMHCMQLVYHIVSLHVAQRVHCSLLYLNNLLHAPVMHDDMQSHVSLVPRPRTRTCERVWE